MLTADAESNNSDYFQTKHLQEEEKAEHTVSLLRLYPERQMNDKSSHP